MQKLTSFLHFIDSISDWSGKIISFLLLGLMGIVLIEVVSRYCFRSPTIWVHELSLYFLGGAGMIGGAYTLLHGGHVPMDVVYNRLSLKGRAMMDLLTFFFFIFFIGVLLWKGWDITWKAFRGMERTESVWGPVIWPSRLMLVIGGLLLLLQGLAKFVRDLLIIMGKVKP